MGSIELDLNKIKNVDLSNVDIEQIKQMQLDAEESSSEDDTSDVPSFIKNRTAELQEEYEQKEIVYDLVALGAKRKIGKLDFTAVLGNVVLLNIIDSPLVSGELEGEVSFEDVAQALYVLYHGEKALLPIMSIATRIEDLYLLKPMCKDNPEMCEQVLAKVEEISSARQEFSATAIRFYEEHFTGSELQEVFDGILKLLTDIISSIDEVSSPDSGEDNGVVKKK